MEHRQNEAESLAQPSQEQPATESKEPIIFEKLTPTCLSDDEMQGYSQALDFVFQENDLLNIAITGPYASGKSSVIKTYEEKLNEINGIHISLSYFSPTLESKIKGQKKVDELIFEDELMLERKIINQLVHQIDPDKIPATEFKLKSESKKWSYAIGAVAISLIISSLIFIDKTWLSNLRDEHNNMALLLMFLFFCLVAYVIYRILDLQSRKGLIRKLKIFENEIDISSSENEVSYFDKYLNEIIYILDESKLDYIVFEDIDRYDDNLILNKLRELNYTYNKKQSKNKPKPIKFLYLIKDEIFESKERTKFFDYILPIVPVMDNSNSLGKMEQIFKSKNIFNDFTATFLDTLSLYLDDIRLIKNICNEYIIYKTKLAHGGSWFKTENLLAVIVYKNIFPADFSLTRLGLGQGVVHRIIESLKNKKNLFYQEQIKNIDDQIQSIEEKINIIETSYLKNIDELQALYINIPYDIKIEYKYVDGMDIFTLNPKEFIHALKKNDLIIDNGRRDERFYYQEYDCEEYFKELEQNFEYQERKKEIEIISTNDKSILEAEIKNLEKEKAQLKLPKKITELIRIQQNNGVAVEALFKEHIDNKAEGTRENKKYKQYRAEYEKLSSSCYFPLLRMLIIQGYIDEYYNDYTSLFNEQGLPQNDTLFLRNINERINTEWELELKKPELVLKKLKADKFTYFTENSVLNYSLLDYILATNKIADLSLFINLLVSCTETNFVNEYLARCYALLANEAAQYKLKYLCLFIEKLNEQFPQIWQHINLFGQKLYLYLLFILNQKTILDKMNEDNKLKEFIEHSADFLLVDAECNAIFKLLDEPEYSLSKIINTLVKLDIKFIQIAQSTPQLLELVEQNNSYQLNQINVNYILENQYNLANFDSRIIETVLALDDEAPIKLYFQTNPEKLVLSITESDIATIDDNEETALFILNHAEISAPVKTAYIDKLSTIITELNQTTDKNIWDKLLEKQKIAYSAENIVHYFFNYELEDEDEDEDEADSKSETREINEQLVHFINQNTNNISSEKANLYSLITEDNEISLFFRRITINSSLDDTKYSMLMSWFDRRYYINFDYQNIAKAKISILIQHKAIRLGEKQDLNFIREHYPDNVVELITHNFDGYINKLTEDDSLIEHAEIISLLSADLSLKQKTALLDLTNEPVSINHANYSVELQQHLLENNFDTDDFAYITSAQSYHATTKEIRNKIKQLCIEYKTQMIEIEHICYELLIELLACEEFSADEKYTLLSNQIHHLNVDNTYNAFKIIEQDSTHQGRFSSLFIAKRPSFENTELNQKIMAELNKKWQFTTKVEDNQIIAYGKRLVKG
ncbi:hypothetical protein SALWKB12_1386 [Snodgrassella communis]|uniref:YobI family P-loop NTPase n=1 Tax=Snodgrassella communis TaxID=2946699 RepID=UPI000460FAB4|nr:hypothetical protein [Snodgrassella communis]KDN12298.1 hypothetical protein SALWKB12_1386 [Snodgrassella communis]